VTVCVVLVPPIIIGDVICVVKVGDVPKTFAPVPVSSVKAVASCEEVNEPRDVAFPVDVMAPVRLAFVVTVPAVSQEAVPVKLVPTPVITQFPVTEKVVVPAPF